MAYCENCGTELTDGVKFCKHCGVRVGNLGDGAKDIDEAQFLGATPEPEFMSASEFFSDEDDKRISFSVNDQYIKEEDGYKTYWLVPTAQKLEMEPIIVEIEPNSKTYEDTPHEGEEFGYVLEGAIELVYGNRKVSVKKGESFYIETNKIHYLLNKTNKKAKVLWVSCPPNF